MIQYNGQVGTQHQNIQIHSRHMTALYQLNKKSKKREHSVEVGTNYEHQRAKDYLTQQHRNSNSSSITTKMIASNIPARSYTNIIHWLFPVEVTKKIKQKKPSPPLRTSQGTSARSNFEKAHNFTEHLGKVFQPHPPRKLTRRGRSTYATSQDPLLTRTTNQPSQKS
jgi:hypothetical protein